MYNNEKQIGCSSIIVITAIIVFIMFLVCSCKLLEGVQTGGEGLRGNPYRHSIPKTYPHGVKTYRYKRF